MTPKYYEERRTEHPVIFTPNIVLFPGQRMTLDLEGGAAQSALEDIERQGGEALFVTLHDDGMSPDMGTLARVVQGFRLADGVNKVLVQGVHRVRIEDMTQSAPFPKAAAVDYIYHPELIQPRDADQKLMHLVAMTAVHYLKAEGNLSESMLMGLLNTPDPCALSDEICAQLTLKAEEAEALLGELDIWERLRQLYVQLTVLNELAELSAELDQRVTERMNQSQKEYMLREQMQMIRDELGEDPQDPASLEETYQKQIAALDMPQSAKESVLKEVERMSYLPPSSPELNVSRSYLDTVLDLPWGVYSKDTLDLQRSRSVLDRRHYGLKEVKERILEFIAVRQLRQDSKGSILCLVGPPGVGKTSIARSIAESLNRRFTSMRLGGVTDESEIRGHRKTYIGSMPGRIIAQMIKSHTMNPVFLFDEIDKIGSDYRGDPASALLEVLDPEQNSEFTDRYLEIPFDLSQVMFLTTANTTDTIPRPLLDRMEVIEISGYTAEEKFSIAKKFLLPKQRKDSGLTAKQLHVAPEVLREVIHRYTREAGVRELERQIGKICRRAAKEVVEGAGSVRVRVANLTDYLDEPRYRDDDLAKRPEVGVVNGLAWTEVGGEILHIEANIMDGRGEIQLTGSLGNVMKESALAAISYIRSNAKRYGVEENFHALRDIHIHMPEGAVPKDGPSAGVSMATAVVSALTKRPVRNDVAMTGEITLTGRVLPVGGIKEKILAARRYRIGTVLLPLDNQRDLKEIPPEILAEMTFVPITTLDDVISATLLEPVSVKETVLFQQEKKSTAMGFFSAIPPRVSRSEAWHDHQ